MVTCKLTITFHEFHEVSNSTDNRLNEVYNFRRSYIDNFINLLDSFDLDITDLTLNHKAQYLQKALEVALSVIPSQNVILSSNDNCWMKLFMVKRNNAFQRNMAEYKSYKEKVLTE